MAARIDFLAGSGVFQNLAGSGLGFYGASFGTSVQVGQFQTTTFITGPDGTAQASQASNCKKLGTASGVNVNGVDTTLDQVENGSGSLNVRFTFDSAVKTQNAELRIFDRVNKNNDPSGVTCYVAEIIKPWAGGAAGSGDAAWLNAHGSGVTCPLVASPGVSGQSPAGANTTAVQHDWYVAMSASPSSIGSKTQFGIYCELEYL